MKIILQWIYWLFYLLILLFDRFWCDRVGQTLGERRKIKGRRMKIKMILRDRNNFSIVIFFFHFVFLHSSFFILSLPFPSPCGVFGVKVLIASPNSQSGISIIVSVPLRGVWHESLARVARKALRHRSDLFPSPCGVFGMKV